MVIEEKNFIVTKDENARQVLISNNFTELPNAKGDLYVFVNEPKKFSKFSYESLPIRFTNKLYF